MMYTKPEMEIEKFEVAENITAGSGDLGTGSVGGNASSASVEDKSIGSDLIIG